MVRSAGMSAQLMAKEGAFAQVRLPSGEVRKVPMDAKATIGTVGNTDHENVRIGKAGRKRHMGVRPTVRGVVMNPCDHPHGGGEGKSPVGMPAPVTPWGKDALGLKTRKHKKYSNKMIVSAPASKPISKEGGKPSNERSVKKGPFVQEALMKRIVEMNKTGQEACSRPGLGRAPSSRISLAIPSLCMTAASMFRSM